MDKQHSPARVQLRGVDGLRTVAVFVVLIYHFMPALAPAGMIGVDVFFVISGFLITSLLLQERRRSGRIDLRGFAVRRFRRLMPALCVVLVACAFLAFLIGGDILLGIRRQLVSGTLFVYNWAEILAGSSYFDQAQPELFTNVWSLAVEEQFYLLWPPILLALLWRRMNRRSRYRAGAFAGASAVLSFGLAIVLLGMNASADRVYMGTDAHAFGLMLGSSYALWHGHTLNPLRQTEALPQARSVRGMLGWVGLVGILVWSARGPVSDPFLQTLTLGFASILSLLVIQALLPEVSDGPGPGCSLLSFLELAPLRWLGQRSYGIYLWHWPLLIVVFYTAPRLNAVVVAIFVTVASIVLADLSFRFVETPIRRHGLVRGLAVSAGERRRVLAVVAALGVIGVVGASVRQPAMSSAQAAIVAGQKSLAAKQNPGAAEGAKPDDGTSREGAKPSDGTAEPVKDGESTTSSAQPTEVPAPPKEVAGSDVLMIGDSVMLASAPSLQSTLDGVYVDAEVSRSIRPVPEILTILDDQIGPRTYVVLGVSTNAIIRPDELEDILDYLGPDRKLVLVTGYGPARTTWVPIANDAIAACAAAYPEQVAVADWNAIAASHPDLLAGDQVHPLEAGQKLYAEEVKRALTDLSSKSSK